MKHTLKLLLVGSIALAGCESPEAGRSRGSGAGADVGNRPPAVKMHEGSQPFWKTPDRIDLAHPPLDAARQARQFSAHSPRPAPSVRESPRQARIPGPARDRSYDAR
jgi:hypothetical protein